LLELIWLTEKDNLFLKGLLQMTVAIYHYEYGNIKGARLMMQAGHSYIQSYRPFHWGVDLEKVNAFIEECLVIIPSGIQSVSFEKAGQLPKLPALYYTLKKSMENLTINGGVFSCFMFNHQLNGTKKQSFLDYFKKQARLMAL
jgi:hypothetical protein